VFQDWTYFAKHASCMRRPSMRPRRRLSWRAVSWMCVRGVPRYATAILASDETSPSLTRCSMNNPADMTPSNRIRLFDRRSSSLGGLPLL
jgi:hypothetical protein